MKLLITTQTIDKNDPILGFFHGWVEEFAKHFERVDVICLREGVHTLPDNVHVHSLGKENGENKLKYLFRFYKYFYILFFRVRVDYVLFHMGAIYNILAAPFFLIRKIRKTKFFWWKTHGLLNLTGRIALTCVDEVVTAGSKSFNAKTNKVRSVGHAVDTDALLYSEKVSEHTGLKTIAVGRITPIKKNEIAVNVIAEYRRTVNDQISLDLYGPVTDAAYKTKLDAEIMRKHLETQVTFCGAKTQAEMWSVYSKYDVLIHPSYEAGFDKVVLEAMAAGVIPVTSIQSFEPVLGPLGLYAAPQDVAQYVEMLSRIRNMRDTERSELRKRLRKIVETEHSIGTLSERIFGVL